MTHIYIEEQTQFDELCQELSQEKEFAFDTEFIRENSFVPILCLMQIATKRNVYIIDPLHLDLTNFLPILTNKNIAKILHSSTQDIDVFFKNFEIIPQNIFDTQIAASFLGYGETISYAKLARKILRVDLKKDSKLTNWKARPLNNHQLEYAASDVKYLIKIKRLLEDELIKQDRLGWVLEELNHLYDKNNYYVDPDESWHRIPANGGDVPYFYNYLRAFAKFREELAVKLNRPRRHVIKDEIVIRLARLQPQKIEDISKDRIVKRMLPSKWLDQIIEISEKVKEYESEELTLANKKPLSDEQDLTVDLLKLYLKYSADKYNIASKYIATNPDIKNFIRGEAVKFQLGWRYEVFGKVATEMLSGEKILKISNGRIEFD